MRVINTSINDSTTKVLNANVTVLQPGSIAAGPFALILDSGTRQDGFRSYVLDTTTLSDGTYNISVNATDSAGNEVQLCDPNIGITRFTWCLLNNR